MSFAVFRDNAKTRRKEQKEKIIIWPTKNHGIDARVFDIIE